jgi:hypothetical protein
MAEEFNAGRDGERAMKPLGLGILTGILVATITASLAFALTDQTSPATTTRPSYTEPASPAPAPWDKPSTAPPHRPLGDYAVAEDPYSG